jgi:hypothetical protein
MVRTSSGRSCRPTAIIALFLAFGVLPAAAAAQDQPPDGSEGGIFPTDALDAVERADERVPVSVPLDADRDLAEIEVDGLLDEPDWDSARLFTGFVQREPIEGAPVEYETEVRMLFGDEAIWIAARMWDSDPESIEKRLTRRDDRATVDNFSVHLDPNLDGLTGYSFRVSAANVQGDTYFYNDDQMDQAWDAVWSSAVQIDDQGWTVEMRIPLSQIRYQASDDPQTWGVNFHRFRVANNERSYHTLVSQLRQGLVSQMGRMEDVRVTRPSRRLEILPYAVSSLHQGPADPADPFFDGSAAGGRFGMDVSYGLGAAFTLDATINPDFGQVEADPAVINLSAFETFFPEQRPFFVEDARVFDFGLSGGRNSLFYSRRIGRSPQGGAPNDTDYTDIPDNATILGAAKLAGRTTSGLSIGALAAVTGDERGEGLYEDGSRGDFLVEPRAEFGVLSLAKDFNGGVTQVRSIATGMRRALPSDGSFDWLPSSAFSGGLRFEHQWADRDWSVYGFYSGSHVRGSEAAMERIQTSSVHYLQRPDATRYAVDPTLTSLSGRDWRVQLNKSGGEHWTGGIWLAEVSELFAINDLGFSTNAERIDAGFRVGYREIQPGSLFRDYNIGLHSFHNWSHEALDDLWSVDSWHNARTSGNYSLNFNGQFLNYWGFRTNVSYNPQQMSRRQTRGGPMMVNPAQTRYSLNVDSDRRKRVSFGLRMEMGDDAIGTGGSRQFGGELRFQPSDNISVEVRPQYESSSSGHQYVTATSALPYSPTFGTRYLFADLEQKQLSMETRVNWTFTPRLSLQLFAQPLVSSGDYLQYKQLSASQSYDFDALVPGAAQTQGGTVECSSSICEVDGTQYVDFDEDGNPDHSFRDRDFNVRSLVGNAVLRWEYRPGSAIFLVWQRQQMDEAMIGNFDFGRDWGALFSAPAENRFILKVNYWMGL